MGQLEDAFRDAAGEVANIKAQPSNRYWWLYGTIRKKNSNGTLDVAIDGVTIQQVKATVSCMMASVGDRVIVLKAGPLMTCVDVIATSDEVKVPASSITGMLPVANGGTGSSSAAEALTALGAASSTDLAIVRESVSPFVIGYRVSDLDLAMKSGIIAYTSDMNNLPVASWGVVLIVGSGGYISQLAINNYETPSGRIWVRSTSGSGWNSWQKVA